MQTEKRRKFIINVLYWVLVLAIVYFVFKYLLNLIMPFFIAFVVAFLLKPLIRLLHEKCRLPKGLSSVLCVVIFYGLVGLLLTLAGTKIITSVKDLLLGLPAFYTDTVQPALQTLSDTISRSVHTLDPDVIEAIENFFNSFIDSLGSAISGLSVKAVSAASGAATSLPGAVLSVLITLISTFFISGDYQNIVDFIVRQMSPRVKEITLQVKKYTVEILLKYMRSYLLIMLITFTELSIGLAILGVEKPLLIALLIAIFDILPVFGTGGVMIPWAILSAVSGDYRRALGLLVVYVIITVIRNIIEPRIVGQQVGLHPVATLLAMFVGTALFGVIGLFGLPITLALLVSLDRSGVIHIFKKEEETEG